MRLLPFCLLILVSGCGPSEEEQEADLQRRVQSALERADEEDRARQADPCWWKKRAKEQGYEANPTDFERILCAYHEQPAGDVRKQIFGKIRTLYNKEVKEIIIRFDWSEKIHCLAILEASVWLGQDRKHSRGKVPLSADIIKLIDDILALSEERIAGYEEHNRIPIERVAKPDSPRDLAYQSQRELVTELVRSLKYYNQTTELNEFASRHVELLQKRKIDLSEIP